MKSKLERRTRAICCFSRGRVQAIKEEQDLRIGDDYSSRVMTFRGGFHARREWFLLARAASSSRFIKLSSSASAARSVRGAALIELVIVLIVLVPLFVFALFQMRTTALRAEQQIDLSALYSSAATLLAAPTVLLKVDYDGRVVLRNETQENRDQLLTAMGEEFLLPNWNFASEVPLCLYLVQVSHPDCATASLAVAAVAPVVAPQSSYSSGAVLDECADGIAQPCQDYLAFSTSCRTEFFYVIHPLPSIWEPELSQCGFVHSVPKGS